MMKGILQQETVLEEKNRGTQHHQKLVQKLSAKAKSDYANKKERHIMRKKYMASRVQPGGHQNIFKQSDFRQAAKHDYLQFFGTTDVKIKADNFVDSKNVKVGPGLYEAVPGSFQPKAARRAGTAGFIANRKDLLFSGNANPGPLDYASTAHSKSFQAKSWQTNIGAFGTTERKFASFHTDQASRSHVPGPGSYSSQAQFRGKYALRKVKG